MCTQCNIIFFFCLPRKLYFVCVWICDSKKGKNVREGEAKKKGFTNICLPSELSIYKIINVVSLKGFGSSRNENFLILFGIFLDDKFKVNFLLFNGIDMVDFSLNNL